MKYTNDCSLDCFPAWMGGLETLNVLLEKGDCDEVERIIEDNFCMEPPTETEINDFLWFERDYIAEQLGYADWDAYEYGEDEGEDEDEDEDGDEYGEDA